MLDNNQDNQLPNPDQDIMRLNQEKIEIKQAAAEHLRLIDEQIARIQRSTKTTFPVFTPIHNNLRAKYKWYYNWHLFKYVNQAHLITLAIYTSAIILGFIWAIFIGPYKPVKASIDFAPGVEKNVDYSAIYKSVKPDAHEVVAKRTENQKVFQNPDGTQQYIISGGPLHYKDSNNAFKNIDSSILTKEDGSGFTMDKSIYSANFNKEFTADPLVQISKDDQNLSMKPGDLSLSNATESQKISDPLTSTGESNGHQVLYKNAYGPGLDFSYETQDLQLNKKLNISTLESLPVPTIDMTSETDANLKLNLEFGINAGLELFIDNTPWDGSQTTIENKSLVFKKDGKVAWQLTPPKAWDSSSVIASDDPSSSLRGVRQLAETKQSTITGKAIISMTGDKLKMSVLFPYSWLKTAQYPVTIDPDTYYGETTDGMINGWNGAYLTAWATSYQYDIGSTFITVGQYYDSQYIWYDVRRAYLEFNTSGIDDAATVTQANLYLTAIDDFSYGPDFNVRIHKYNWGSPIGSGNRETNYDGALAGTYDADWRSTSGMSTNTSYSSANLDTTWVQKGATKTQYALLSSRDVAATTPTGSEQISLASQENATQAYRPYLSITVAAGPNSCQSAATGNWNAAGSWTACGGTTPQPGDSATILNGHTITMTADASITTGSITINTGGVLTTGNFNLTTTNLTDAGTLTAGASTITVSGNWASSGTFNRDTSTLKLTGTGTLTPSAGTGGSNFYNLEMAYTGQTTTLAAAINIRNVLTTQTGTVGTSVGFNAIIYIRGANANPYVTDATTPATMSPSGVQFYYSGLVDMNVPKSSYHLWTCNPNKTSGKCTLTGAVTATSSTGVFGAGTTVLDTNGNSLTTVGLNIGNGVATGGKMIINGSTLTSTGDVTISDNAGSELNFTGTTPSLVTSANFTFSDNDANGTRSGIITPSVTSTINFNKSSSTQTLITGGTGTNKAFNHLTHSGAGALVISTNDLDINGNFTNSAGTFTLTGRSLTIAGNTSFSSGTTFTKGTAVTFDGATASTFTDSTATAQNLGPVTLNKTDTGTPATNNKLTLASSMTVDTMTIDGTAGSEDTLNLASGGYTLKLANAGATATVLTNSGTLTVGTSTIDYAATNSGGNVNIVTMPYSSLKTSGAETYVMTGNLSGANAITGSLTIGTGSTLSTVGNYNIDLAGSWTNSGTFTANSGTVTFNSSSASQTVVTNAQAFYALVLNNTGAGGSDKLIISGTLDVNGLLTITDGNLDLATNNPNVTFTGLTFSIGASGSLTKGSGTFTFDNQGGGFTQNWSDATSGQDMGAVVIGVGATTTVSLATAVKATSITVNTGYLVGGSGTLNTTSLIISGGGFTAGSGVVTVGTAGSGTGIYTHSSGAVNWTSNSGTLNYFSNGSVTLPADTYYSLGLVKGSAGGANVTYTPAGTFAVNGNLVVDSVIGGSTLSLGASNLTVTGNVSLSYGGALTVSSANISVGGNWTNGGTFTAGSGTVTFNTTSASIITGTTTFNNLVMNTTTDGAKTITFPTGTGSKQIISGTWTLDGAIGKVLTLVSTSLATAWYFQVGTGFTAGDYINVTDSWSANTNKIIRGANYTDGGNNDGWLFNVAPNAPTALSPAGYVDGAWQTDSTPTLTFNLTDPDEADQVKYEIIISIHSDFSSPTVDYTSALGAQGERSYTADPALADGIYYWEVKAIDASNVASSYSVAGISGTADIKVDTTVPTTDIALNPTNPNGDNSYYKTTAPTVTFASDDGLGSGASIIYYRWGASGDFSAYSAGIQALEGTNTIYYYGTDLVGNSGVSAPLSRTIKVDTVSPTTPGTPSATTPTNIVRPAWSWSASTDTNSGISKYEVQLNGAGGWIDVGNTTSWTTTSDLAEGSNTLKVRSTDNAGNTSAESAEGSVLVDFTSPTISAFTINNSDSTANSTSITLQITASGGSSGLSARQFSQDGVTYSPWESCDNTTCNDEKAYTLNEGDGTKTVYLKVKDSAGNESVASSDNILLDTTGPGAFSLYSPADNSWTNSTAVHLLWESASDSISGLAKYQLYFDDALVNANISNSITSYDLANLAVGTHTWQIKAIDNSNNETLSAKRTFGIDQTAPTAPTNVVVTNLSNTDLKLVKDLPVKIGWTASQYTGAGILSYLIYIGTTPGASDIINGAEVAAPDYATNLQKDGTYYVTVKAKDTAGNISALSSEYSFKVDHSAPNTIAKTVSFDISNRIAGTYSAYIAWSSSSDPSGEGIKEYIVYSGNDKIGTIPFNTDGKESPRRLVQTNLKPGSYSFKVAAVDLADNLGAFSLESKLEILAEAGPALTISDIKATPSTLVDPDSGKTSILITWKTNSLATSVVEMEGKTYGEEDLTKLNSGHSILITDLKDSTTYRFLVKSRDIFGSQITSESTSVRTSAITKKQSLFEIILKSLRDIFSVFKTVSAATLQKIGLIKPTQITKEGLILYNVSDAEVGNAIVISLVKPGQAIEKSSDGKNFAQLATPAESYYVDDKVTAPNTYYYRLIGSTGIARINLGNKEDSAPVISDSKVIEEATQVADDKVRIVVGWQTDIPSTSQISYGIGDTNLESTKDESLNTSHMVVIEGLKSGTEYKFKAKSAGENGLSSQSNELAFATPKAVESQSIINVIIKQLQDIVSKLISWMKV